MSFAKSDEIQIYYDDRGTGEPALLCLPGWCVHHTMFAALAERLGQHHRVLIVDWRGHGKSQTSDSDFGYTEMVADVLAVIEASGAQSVIPIAQAHGGWVATELRRRLDHRVPRMIFTNWNPIFTRGNSLAKPFLDAMQALQDEARWRATVEQLFAMWLADAPASLASHIRSEMGSHGYEDWARAGREIEATYGREGDPLEALSGFSPPVSVLHLYGHPRAPEYLAAQESFAQDHPWFVVRRLEAASHFPTIEVPDETAAVITEFIE